MAGILHVSYRILRRRPKLPISPGLENVTWFTRGPPKVTSKKEDVNAAEGKRQIKSSMVLGYHYHGSIHTNFLQMA